MRSIERDISNDLDGPR